MNWNEELIQARKSKGYTQKQFSKLSNIPFNTYMRYEQGLRIPRKKRAKHICELLNLDPGVFYRL